MPNQIINTTWKTSHRMLMPANPDKDQKYRIGTYLDWLARNHLAWYQPALDRYRDYLLHERTQIHPKTGAAKPATLAPQTVKTHLATIRGRYELLLQDNTLRDTLFELTPPDKDFSQKKAFVDELITRLENAIHPRHSKVKTLTIQDETDSDHLRLNPDQVQDLLRTPGVSTLPGLRDTAMIAMMICTGVREAELVNIRVDDLRQRLDNELALRIRSGKNYKQRLVPYGPLDWCLLYVDRWMAKAAITAGYVFRGFYKGSKRVRPTGITTRAVNLIMNTHPIMIDGQLRPVQPHDLRRTYARNAYENGMDLERIRQNLGHVKIETTLIYIGELDGTQRRPPAMFRSPYSTRELKHRWENDE